MPFTSEESITSAYVKNENPDVIINIVDATYFYLCLDAFDCS